MAKRVFAVIVVLTLALALLALAQAPAAPKPTPEHKRLGYFVGTWTFEGEAKAFSYWPAGKFTGTEHAEWFPGRFYVVTHSDAKGPGGPWKSMSIMGYNPEEKVYTYYAIESGTGIADVAKATVQGDTWIWNGDAKVGGRLMKLRYTLKEVSPTSYTWKFESSPDGKTWAAVEEGKAAKTK